MTHLLRRCLTPCVIFGIIGLGLGIFPTPRLASAAMPEVPAEVVARIARFEGDPAAVRAAGIDVAVEFAQTLLDDGAAGLHFYTLNRASVVMEILQRLDLGR